MPKVNDLGHGHAIMESDQDVGRFEVAMDDALLMGMLHGLADRDETSSRAASGQKRFSSQYCVIGMPRTSSITKLGPTAIRSRRRRTRGRCSDDPSARVPGVQPRSGRSPRQVSMPLLMTFASATRPPHGLLLLSHPHQAEAALPDFLQQQDRSTCSRAPGKAKASSIARFQSPADDGAAGGFSAASATESARAT